MTLACVNRKVAECALDVVCYSQAVQSGLAARQGSCSLTPPQAVKQRSMMVMASRCVMDIPSLLGFAASHQEVINKSTGLD